jgi:hypothetical protein
MSIPDGKIIDIILHLRIIENEFFITYTIYYEDGRKINLSDDECGDCIWNLDIKKDISEKNITTNGSYNIKEIKNFKLIDFDLISTPEEIELGDNKITINIQKIILQTISAFFFLEPGDMYDYGLKVSEIDEINESPSEERANIFYSKMGISNPTQPGFSNLIEGVIKSIVQTLLYFAKLFISAKVSAINLLLALVCPVCPTNIKTIKDTIEKLKELILEIKGMLTETEQWIRDTFLGPLGSINMPLPSFILNVGEYVPAFPIPLPIPKINPINMDSFKPSNEDIDFAPINTDDLFKYSNPVNNITMNTLKNIPYLQYIDTTFLIENSLVGSSDIELGASDLKRINMFKSMAIMPIKIIVGIINSLLSSVIGLFTFDFSKLGELVKTMIPTLDSIKTLVLKILDSFIPNISKVMENVNNDIKPPISQEELQNQIDSVKDINVGDLKYNGPTIDDINFEIINYEKNINEIIELLDNLKNQSINNPLSNYINKMRIVQSDISNIENNINEKLSDITMPNMFQTKNKITLINEVLLNINSIDKKIDNNYNPITETIYEDNITEFYDNIGTSLNIIYENENNQIVKDFINYYKEIGTIPINLNELGNYITSSKKFIQLDLNTIETYFDDYDNISVNYLNELNNTIIYIKKLKYIKFILKNRFLKKILKYKELLINFKNILIGDGYTPDNFSFTEMENKYNIILNIYNSEYYTILNTYYNINSNIIDRIIENIPIVLNNFKNINISSGHNPEPEPPSEKFILELKYNEGNKYYFNGNTPTGIIVDGSKIKATEDIKIFINYDLSTIYIDDNDEPHAESELILNLYTNNNTIIISEDSKSTDDYFSKSTIKDSGEYLIKNGDYFQISGRGFNKHDNTNGNFILSINNNNNNNNNNNLLDIFNKDDINNIIIDIQTISNYSLNFNELLLIDLDLNFINLTEEQLNLPLINNSISQISQTNVFYEEDKIINYFISIKKLVTSLNNLVKTDISMQVFDDGNKIDNSIRNKCTDFLTNIIIKTDELNKNNDNLYDFLNYVNDSIELEKKISTTQPNMETASQLLLPIMGIINEIPKIFLEIFKEVFGYALEEEYDINILLKIMGIDI